MARKKKTDIDGTSEPKVVKGSHLTVITDSEGRITLEWDDEALLRDVQEAIASVENTVEKKVTRKKAK